jgi:hypothetical protein
LTGNEFWDVHEIINFFLVDVIHKKVKFPALKGGACGALAGQEPAVSHYPESLLKCHLMKNCGVRQR